MRTSFSLLVVGVFVLTGVLVGSETPMYAQVSVQITPPLVRVYPRRARVWVPAYQRCTSVPGHWVYRPGLYGRTRTRIWVSGRQRCITVPGHWVYRR